MEIVYDCPFGSKCEEVKNNEFHRCRFYIQIRGKDPQSEETIDRWDCTFSWLPLIMLENAQTNRGQTQALESFRNEVIRGQKEFSLIFMTELEKKKSLVLLEDNLDIKESE